MSARLDELEEWIGRADLDLRSAQILASTSGLAIVACYLCQQACEKALKAMLVSTGRGPPRIHDLLALGREATAAGFIVPCDEERLSEWSAYAVASRYPGFGDARAEEDLSELLDFAKALLEAARRLKARGGS